MQNMNASQQAMMQGNIQQQQQQQQNIPSPMANRQTPSQMSPQVTKRGIKAMIHTLTYDLYVIRLLKLNSQRIAQLEVTLPIIHTSNHQCKNLPCRLHHVVQLRLEALPLHLYSNIDKLKLPSNSRQNLDLLDHLQTLRMLIEHLLNHQRRRHHHLNHPLQSRMKHQIHPIQQQQQQQDLSLNRQRTRDRHNPHLRLMFPKHAMWIRMVVLI